MASPPSSPPTPTQEAEAAAGAAAASPEIDDTTPTDTAADLPMTMAASVILDNLPRDTHRALETAGEVLNAKGEARVKIRLSPLPSTPALRSPVFTCQTSHRFEFVVRFLRGRLRLGEHEGVFCYVNSVFAPGLDEGIGNLWRCFKTGDELVVSYSVTQAFG